MTRDRDASARKKHTYTRSRAGIHTPTSHNARACVCVCAGSATHVLSVYFLESSKPHYVRVCRFGNPPTNVGALEHAAHSASRRGGGLIASGKAGHGRESKRQLLEVLSAPGEAAAASTRLFSTGGDLARNHSTSTSKCGFRSNLVTIPRFSRVLRT